MEELKDIERKLSDELDKAADRLLFNILTNTTSEVAPTEPIEPLIIEGRPFTPDDLQHLDELNEEMLKQNPPKPYQWGPQLTPQSTRELMYARFFGQPIILDTPDEKTEE